MPKHSSIEGWQSCWSGGSGSESLDRVTLAHGNTYWTCTGVENAVAYVFVYTSHMCIQ